MTDTIYVTCRGCGWVFRAEVDDDSVCFACPRCGYVHFLYDSRGRFPGHHTSRPERDQTSKDWTTLDAVSSLTGGIT